jgi:hypothetical protein
MDRLYVVEEQMRESYVNAGLTAEDYVLEIQILTFSFIEKLPSLIFS